MSTQSASPSLSPALVVLLALSSGAAVANIYYNQPMLGLLARDLGLDAGQVGMVPVVTQVGYAVGILLLSPLGDRIERKRLILLTMAALAVALGATALSGGLVGLCVASLAVGLLATVTQQIVPLSAQIAPPDQRGRVVGMVMMGVLLGILLARTVSGVVGEQAGWREMYWLAAGVTVVVGAALALWLPRVAPTTCLSYPRLMGSLVELARCYPVLRRAGIIQALIFGAFTAFWSTLALLLQGEPYHMGSAVAGAFGLVGAAGALAAPLAGRFADRRGTSALVILGAVLVCASFVLFGLWQGSVTSLILGVLAMDLGTQAAMVSNQTRIYALDPGARSRLNTVYMTVMFTGGAAGAAAGNRAWTAFGWTGVCVLGSVMGGVAVLVEVVGRRRAAR